VVDFVLYGQSFTATSAGPLDPFNHAVSLVVSCDSQAEIDRYWEALLQGGGSAENCGWLKDHFGVYWQVVPAQVIDMMANPDRAKARLVAETMLKKVKFDIAQLQHTYQSHR
jgi:predicted 3-demethylubiquinone-9 3-methyltransferase (glyoxalase superfamily)